MIYEFKCNECKSQKEINVPTWDIHTKNKHSLGIDQSKLDERINEKRECECGGELKKIYSNFGEPIFVQVDKQRFL